MPSSSPYEHCASAVASVLVFTPLSAHRGRQFGRSARPLIRAAFFILALASRALGQFSSIDFAHNSNAQNWFPDFPTGNVTLGGVPFAVPTSGNNVWHSDLASGANPRILDIPVNVYGVDRINSLINSFWGESAPGTFAAFEFYGSNGAFHSIALDGGSDVRDYLQGSHANAINGTTTINVYTAGQGFHNERRVDMQKIILPEAFRTQTLQSIRLIDNGTGWIGAVSPLEQRTYLAGLTAQSSPSTIQAPAYVIPRSPDNVILITHGWKGPSVEVNPTSQGWVAELAAAVATRITMENREKWQVIGYDWYDSSATTHPGSALNNAVLSGTTAGLRLATQHYSHVQLIGHSAGAGVIASIGEQISNESPSTSVHFTFLDPFTPSQSDSALYNSHSPHTWYGAHRPVDWADNYFTHDVTQYYPDGSTEMTFGNANNVDVTRLDPNVSVELVTGLPLSSHGWPTIYYTETVINNGSYPGALRLGEVDTHGFGLSLGGGRSAPGSTEWENPVDDHPNGDVSILEPSSRLSLPSVRIDEPLVLAPSSGALTSTGGNGVVSNITGNTDLMFETEEFNWTRVGFTAAHTFNAIVLHAGFYDEGGNGTLGIYMDNAPVGQIISEYSVIGSHAYAFGFYQLTPGYHELAFALIEREAIGMPQYL